MEIKNATEYKRDRLRILAIGPAGSGKTTQLRTLPGKKLLFCFEDMGQQPAMDDWAAQLNTIENTIRKVTSLPKTVYITAHDNLMQDDLTKKIVNELVLTGQLKTRIPMLFSDILKFQCEDEKFSMLTQPDRYNIKIRRSLPNLDAVMDVTIQDFGAPQNFGLGRLIKR